MSELLVPAQITQVRTLDHGELRLIELTLPKEWEIDGRVYPIQDLMRPGTAFLTKPRGLRTQKWRRRMYTRSNTRIEASHVLETVINHTHTEKSDTSVWWQTDEILEWQRSGKPLEVRMQWNDDHSALIIYENSQKSHATNLRLEPDGTWEHLSYLAVAFSTGITPFLAYLRYMKHVQFGRSATSRGTTFTLIASAKHPQQLIAHEELLALHHEFPDNFSYQPVLTRSWPDEWPFTTGRIILGDPVDDQKIDLSPLLAVVPNIGATHVRFCGNKLGRAQLQKGLEQQGIQPISFRAEVW